MQNLYSAQDVNLQSFKLISPHSVSFYFNRYEAINWFSPIYNDGLIRIALMEKEYLKKYVQVSIPDLPKLLMAHMDIMTGNICRDIIIILRVYGVIFKHIPEDEIFKKIKVNRIDIPIDVYLTQYEKDALKKLVFLNGLVGESSISRFEETDTIYIHNSKCGSYSNETFYDKDECDENDDENYKIRFRYEIQEKSSKTIRRGFSDDNGIESIFSLDFRQHVMCHIAKKIERLSAYDHKINDSCYATEKEVVPRLPDINNTDDVAAVLESINDYTLGIKLKGIEKIERIRRRFPSKNDAVRKRIRAIQESNRRAIYKIRKWMFALAKGADIIKIWNKYLEAASGQANFFVNCHYDASVFSSTTATVPVYNDVSSIGNDSSYQFSSLTVFSYKYHNHLEKRINNLISSKCYRSISNYKLCIRIKMILDQMPCSKYVVRGEGKTRGQGIWVTVGPDITATRMATAT